MRPRYRAAVPVYVIPSHNEAKVEIQLHLVSYPRTRQTLLSYAQLGATFNSIKLTTEEI